MSQAAQRGGVDPNGGICLQTLAAAITNGVITIRRERVVWASDRFAEMAGRGSPAVLIDLPLRELFADTGSGLPDSMTPRAIECALTRLDGETRTVICRAVEPEDAGAVADTWVIEDVTHVRLLERELLRMSQATHRANREVAGLRERLGRERDEREELLTVVSHELRTPVTIISGYNKLLLSEQVGPLTDEQRRFLNESSKGCHRLNTFIGNLLEAWRVSSDAEILEIAHAKLTPVVESVVGLLRPLLEEAELQLEVDISPEADRARFDRLRLEQILTNLIGNAIKFSSRGGTIGIATCAVVTGGDAGPSRPCVEFRITDSGPGVALADRERIFEPYIQVGEESRAGGLGLGLAICKRLVAAHGGSISVTGSPGGGSCFTFTLPVTGDPPLRTDEKPNEGGS